MTLCLCLVQPVWAEVQPEQPITLRQAVESALETHLNTRLSRERIRESEARIGQSLAALNPQVNFSAGQYNRSINLAAQGLAGGGGGLPIPTFIGPFYSFDSRVQLVYNFVDAANKWKLRSAEVGRQLADDELVLARRQVGVLTCLAYVQLLGARHAQQAGLADVALAERLLALAKNQKEAGVAAGIDVTRADTQLVEQQLRQRSLDEQVLRASLELARLTGRALTSRFSPQESPLPALEQRLTPDTAAQRGRQDRIELRLARLREDQLDTEISAADASNSPRLGVVADYGFTGNTPGSNVFGTHNVGLALQIPLYDGGLSQARVATLRSQLEQARLQRQDEEIQVEQEVRSAFLKLDLAGHQTTTARAGTILAEREVTMATDRFRAGLTNSLEVVNAQASLTRTRDAEVRAQLNYQLALIELAASMGKPEMILEGGIQ